MSKSKVRRIPENSESFKAHCQLVHSRSCTFYVFKCRPKISARAVPGDCVDALSFYCYPFCKYDDLFYLRYILSFGSAKKSKEAVVWAFQFRADPKFQKIAEICTGADSEAKILDMAVVKESKKWQVADKLHNVFSDETGGSVAVLIRAGMCDSSTMFDRVTKEDLWNMNVMQREASFQQCDALTRETGKVHGSEQRWLYFEEYSIFWRSGRL